MSRRERGAAVSRVEELTSQFGLWLCVHCDCSPGSPVVLTWWLSVYTCMDEATTCVFLPPNLLATSRHQFKDPPVKR